MAQFQKTEQNSMGKDRTYLTCYKDDRGCTAQPPFFCFLEESLHWWPGESNSARVQPQLVQGIRSGDGVGEGKDTIASIRY